MRIALAQINPHLGNFRLNSEKIIEFSRRAQDRRADIVLFPEATLFGYHPADLLDRPSIVEAQLKELNALLRRLPKNILVVFGAFTKNPKKKGKPYFNSAIAVYNGKIVFSCHKQLLPTYDVFDDARFIEPGDMAKNIFRFKGKKVLITICEDIWAWPRKGEEVESYYPRNPIKKIKPGQVDLILNLSASPYFGNKFELRKFVVTSTAKYLKAPMVYVNMVGAQDELIFDGGSFAVSRTGRVLCQSVFFYEDLNLIDLETQEGGFREYETNPVAVMREALVLGLRDFSEKLGIRGYHLGLSGGIDSAVVACLAVDALGPQNVKAFYLPGPFSTSESGQLAAQLAQNLGIEMKTISITAGYDNMVKTLEKAFGRLEFSIMHENLQARLRALILMAYSNLSNSLLLSTSNKSELTTGFGTLYGDLSGALMPIGDLLKKDIYDLARLYNQEGELIPSAIIDRAPSAELRPNQRDEDVLPPYRLLDPAVANMVEKSKKPRNDAERYVLKAMMRNEFKRWQAPPVLKVRERSIGGGRRFPIAHKAVY